MTTTVHTLVLSTTTKKGKVPVDGGRFVVVAAANMWREVAMTMALSLALEVEEGDREMESVAVDEAARRAVGEELTSWRWRWRWKKATERRRGARETRGGR